MFYVPELGRFLARDMIRRPGANPYTYTDNNPLSFVDPDGAEIKVLVDTTLFRKDQIAQAAAAADKYYNLPLKGGDEVTKQTQKNGDVWTQTRTYESNPEAYAKYKTTFDDLGATKGDALNKIVQVLTTATENDQLVIKAHAVWDENRVAIGLTLGTETVLMEELLKALEKAKGTKAKSITFQACSLTDEDAAKIKKILGIKDVYYSEFPQVVGPTDTGLNRGLKEKGQAVYDPKAKTIKDTVTVSPDFNPARYTRWIDETGRPNTMRRAF